MSALLNPLSIKILEIEINTPTGQPYQNLQASAAEQELKIQENVSSDCPFSENIAI